MDYTIWQLIIFIIALGMTLLSAFCVLFPQKLIDIMPRLIDSKLAKFSDVTIRVLLGISLILSSKTAIFPIIFTVFGYLSLAAAIVIIVMGNNKVEAIVKYISDMFSIWTVRLFCLFSVLLFAFLIHNIR